MNIRSIAELVERTLW